MSVLDSLSQNFVYFGDKCFNNILSSQDQIIKWWQEFRSLLTNKPLDLEKIRVFIENMYGIHPITIEAPEKHQFSFLSLSSLQIEKEKKMSSGLLKKKSSILLQNQINYMYRNDQMKSPGIYEEAIGGVINRMLGSEDFDGEKEIFTYSAVDFNFLEKTKPQTFETQKTVYQLDTENLLKNLKEFQNVFNGNSVVLDKNFDNIVKEMREKGLELNKSTSLSDNVIETKLKNISCYFTESYDKVIQHFQNIC